MKTMNYWMRIVCVLMIASLSCTLGYAQQRSVDEARVIAASHMQKRLDNKGRRLAPPVGQPATVRSSELFESGVSGLSEAFYVFNYPDSHCYVMVSADERMGDVLAYSNENDFDFNRLAPQTRRFIEGYVASARQLQNGQIRRYLPATQRRIGGVVGSIAPLITTRWSQNAPYNLKCPYIFTSRCITGCVATMMGQIMYYYQYPTVGKGTCEYITKTSQIPVSAVLDSIPFDWSNMIADYQWGYTHTQSDAISNLMLACGASVEMDYGISSSGASLSNAPSAMIDHFGYDRDMVIVDMKKMPIYAYHEMIQQALLNGHPVPCGGNNVKNEGHAFIIDGLEPDGDNLPFYHINWGWNGYGDDYFKLDLAEYHLDNQILLYCYPDNDSTDCGPFLQAESLVPAVTKMNVTKNPHTGITVDKLWNSKQSVFSGTVYAYLVDDKGNDIAQIGSQKVELMQPYYTSISISVKLPEVLALGTYSFKITAHDDRSSAEEESLVYIAETGSVEITDKDVDFAPDIQVTSMTYNRAVCDGNRLSVSLYNAINMGAVPFMGEITCAIATEKGEIVKYFDNSFSLLDMELQQYSSISAFDPLTINMPDSIDDGFYLVVGMARQNGYEKWGRVRSWVLDGGWITQTDVDISLPLEIKDGKFNIDNVDVPKNYFADIETTELILNENDCHGNTVSLTINDYLNLGNEVFHGDLSLAIANSDNDVVAAFGEKKALKELKSYAMFQGEITMTGEVPDTISDGQYRLCLAVRQQGFENWTPITKATLADNTIQSSKEDCYFDIWIIEGKARLHLYEPADVNHDGSVDTQDVLTIYEYMASSSGDNEFPLEDVNQDGVVDTQDVLAVYNYMSQN